MKSSKHSRLHRQPRLRPQNLLRVYRLLRGKFGHQNWWPGETGFEIIVGAILTQNTAWTNVERAIRNLRKGKLLNPKALAEIRPEKLAALIKPAGYFNVKTKRLKNFIRFLFKLYHGKLRRMFQTDGRTLRTLLLAVNGIGPETADSILLYAGGMPFFVIDAYTKRIFSRHGIYREDTDYHDWQQLFIKHLPKNTALYNDFHAQIVKIGKDYCRKNPRCDQCPLNRLRFTNNR